jgi:hypothetical protein
MPGSLRRWRGITGSAIEGRRLGCGDRVIVAGHILSAVADRRRRDDPDGNLRRDPRRRNAHALLPEARWRRMRSITSRSSMRETILISFWHFGPISGSAFQTSIHG